MKLELFKTPETISRKISAPIPEYVIQERAAGGNQKLSYLSGATVIDMLNSTFGHLGWSSEILEQWKEKSEPYFDSYAKVPDSEKVTNPANGKKGIWVEQAPVVFVKVRLSVYLTREDGSTHTIIKEAFGSKAVIGKQSEQDSTYKSAQTDALKKAASLLGIGTELYRGENEQAYFDVLNRPIVWTEEKQASSELWKSLINVCEQNNWSISDLDSYVSEISEGAYNNIYTLPENWVESILESLQQGE